MDTLTELSLAHDVFVPTDSPFQRRARILQALWREEMGYPIGLHRGCPLGSRVAMPFAEETLANYLTDFAREAVLRETRCAHGSGKLFSYPRIFNDLLSSQPLCINLFAPLQDDLGLATHVFGEITNGRVREVVRFEFEHSPGRGHGALHGGQLGV